MPSINNESVVTLNILLIRTIFSISGYTWSNSHLDTVWRVTPIFSPKASCDNPAWILISYILLPNVIYESPYSLIYNNIISL